MYVVLMADTPITAEQLNELANQGMRLVTIIQFSGKFYFYFYRT